MSFSLKSEAHLLFHFKFNSKNGVSRVHFVQRIYFLKCILKLFCRVNLKSKHVATTLKQETYIYVQGTEAGRKLNTYVKSHQSCDQDCQLR